MLNKLGGELNKKKRRVRKVDDEYTEKDYWEGRVPDELFDEYLKKYGYDYTP